MQQAVVIGSGMGELAAAQVLSRFFDHVVVLERDALEALLPQSSLAAAFVGSKARPGVQQVCGRPAHICVYTCGIQDVVGGTVVWQCSARCIMHCRSCQSA
jgi:choline dehydrogenase-like flavoprotein